MEIPRPSPRGALLPPPTPPEALDAARAAKLRILRRGEGMSGGGGGGGGGLLRWRSSSNKKFPRRVASLLESKVSLPPRFLERGGGERV